MSDDTSRPAGRFAPGVSGNPSGRPKGSRNKLQEDFLRDLYADWHEGGKEALATMRAEKPNEYVRVVAGLLPSKVEVERPLGELSDHELASVLDAVRALIGSAEAGPGGAGGGTEEAPRGTPLN